MQSLALEYLRYADGVEQADREIRTEEHRAKLLETLVKVGLAATGEYQEKVLFQDWFPEESAESDDSVDFTDMSGVDFTAPDESEMEMLARMLADDSITVDGAPLEGPGAVQVDREDVESTSSTLPPPREFDPADVEQDMEWT